MNFWQTKEWVEAKQASLKTDKILSRIEYLKLHGHKEYSEEKYREYLRSMSLIFPQNRQGTFNEFLGEKE